MLTSPAPCHASTDHGFFSSPRNPSKGASLSSSPPTVIVTTRVIQRPSMPPQTAASGPSKLPLHASPPPSTATGLLSMPISKPKATLKKRKSLPTLKSGDDVPRDVKRLRTASTKGRPRKRKSSASSKASSRGSSRSVHLAPSPEPIYLSRSRSTSSFPHLGSDTTLLKRNWRTDEDGTPGDAFLSSAEVVRRLLKSYKTYFENPQDPTDLTFAFDPSNPSAYPWVELEYPNSNASERYILLAPKDKDHYNPIMDLEKTLYTIVEHYCTKEQQALFGPIPTDTLSETDSPSRSPSSSPLSSPAPLPPSSSPSRFSMAGSEYSASSYGNPPQATTSTHPPLLKTLKRALNREDGPTFVRTLATINGILRGFKYPPVQGGGSSSEKERYAVSNNTLMQPPLSWSETGLPHKVMMRIVEENYQRTVGPKVPSLRQYEAFSSTVYGELMPNLVDEIVRITDLKEDSLFLDLGSGVGNVVVQASLQTGCKSFGVELMPTPANVARDVVEQIKIRCRMWGVNVGEMELEEGNMLKSDRLDELMPKADVVLVDNKVFEESLNEALRPKFLDLKEGAIVVSLAPFVNGSNARLTERNVDDISAIFDVTERGYNSGSVSWGNGGGTYYIHRVDRTGYAEIKARFEAQRMGSRRRH